MKNEKEKWAGACPVCCPVFFFLPKFPVTRPETIIHPNHRLFIFLQSVNTFHAQLHHIMLKNVTYCDLKKIP